MTYRNATYLRFGLLLVLGATVACSGRIITVDDDGPADFNNIQGAIDSAVNGDEVVVSDGLYTGNGNRDIDFGGRAITVRSKNGPIRCIIDSAASPEDKHRPFHFHHNEGHDSVLEGFTITGGCGASGGGILCDSSSPVINNCVITGNHSYEVRTGGGICCYTSNAIISNCLITGNKSGAGGGIGCWMKPGPTIINCTISGNWAYTSASGPSGAYDGCGGGISCFDSCMKIHNSIIWGNYGRMGKDIFLSPSDSSIIGGYVDITLGSDRTNCDEAIYWEAGLTRNDPLFSSPGYWVSPEDPNVIQDPPIMPPDFTYPVWVNGDYHLQSQGGRYDPEANTWLYDDVTSPCIDAGDPMSPIGMEPFPNGGVVNLGAYAASLEASKSYFDKPRCETIVAGDINGDCAVNFLDLAILAKAWRGFPAYPETSSARYPVPFDGATEVVLSTLRWEPGNGAVSHDVYFGTSSPGTFQGNQTDPQFSPGPTKWSTTYYWRIDEINAEGTTIGEVWSFTTQADPWIPPR